MVKSYCFVGPLLFHYFIILFVVELLLGREV